MGQPPPWRIPTVPEVEERSFNAANVKEALVKLGLPHKQRLLPQRKQQLVLLLHHHLSQSAGQGAHRRRSKRGRYQCVCAGPFPRSACRPTIVNSCPRGIRRPSSAAGSSDGVGRTRGTDLDAASLCGATSPSWHRRPAENPDVSGAGRGCLDGRHPLPHKMHKAVRACLNDQSSIRQESMLRTCIWMSSTDCV